MSKIAKFKILPELNLIIEYYSGPINLNDIKELKIQEINNKEYNKNFHTLMDGRDTELITHYQDVIDLVEFIKANRDIVGQGHSAFLTKTPKKVSKTILHKILSESLPFNYKVYNTFDAAANFVNISFNDYEFIENTIRNLMNEK